jgi:hypothetical protein
MPRKRKAGDARKAKDKTAPAPPRPKSETKDDPQEYTDLVLLVHAANQAEAELFKTELEAHGVPAVLEGEGSSLAGIGAGVPVLVPEEFADQAAELIAEMESAKPEGKTVVKDELFNDEDDGGNVDELDEEVEEKEDEEEDEEDDLDDEEEDEEDDWDVDDEDADEEEDEEEDEEDEDDDWDDDEDDDDDDDY